MHLYYLLIFILLIFFLGIIQKKPLESISNTFTLVGRYKDNRAYPWPGGESNFILYPESANQTIYTQEMRASDAGRYSCQARNDTTILEGDITLAVIGKYRYSRIKLMGFIHQRILKARRMSRYLRYLIKECLI